MKPLVLNAFLLILISLSAPVAYACECGVKRSPRNELRKAKAVFVGEVVEIKAGEKGNSRLIKFGVKKHWKGVKGNFIIVSSPGGLCGFIFELGQEWLVYAYDDLYTDSCRRTVMLRFAAAELQLLGKAKELK